NRPKNLAEVKWLSPSVTKEIRCETHWNANIRFASHRQIVGPRASSLKGAQAVLPEIGHCSKGSAWPEGDDGGAVRSGLDAFVSGNCCVCFGACCVGAGGIERSGRLRVEPSVSGKRCVCFGGCCVRAGGIQRSIIGETRSWYSLLSKNFLVIAFPNVVAA